MSREIPIIAPNVIPFSTFSQPLIQVYTQAGEAAFPYASIMGVNVKPIAEVPEHPLETGASREDFIIYKPVELEIKLVLSPSYYQSTYSNIKQFYNNATLLNVQTRVDFYRNFLLYEIPHEENATYYNTIAVTVKLREFIQITTTTSIASRKPSTKTTVNRGTIQPVVPTEEQKTRTSILGGLVYKN